MPQAMPAMPHAMPAMAMSAMASAAWSPTAGFAFEGFDRQEEPDEDPLNPDNDPNRFSGRIKGFYETSGGGYGFIDCEAARLKYGRDVYLHSRQMGDAKVGELISFTIVRNGKGEPQARNVMRAEEAMALKVASKNKSAKSTKCWRRSWSPSGRPSCQKRRPSAFKRL
ncbi:unnamed protein product [Durusdinium trenchii]|uniref:Cold-shock domain-containing protein n=1 Tax=Durusdinium trenchii TaxID=1381693 RepID=A0ABP0M909_9DINO